MKNRLMFLALAMICYGNMQAEGWFANQWNRIRNYSPYSATSLRKLSPEDAARRVHTMQFLYGPGNTWELVGAKSQGYNLGKLTPDQQEAVTITYPNAFANEMNKSLLKWHRLTDTQKGLQRSIDAVRACQTSERPAAHLDYYKQKASAEVAKQQKLMKMQDDFLKQYEQEAQISSSPNWLERQRRIQHHPDYFEY